MLVGFCIGVTVLVAIYALGFLIVYIKLSKGQQWIASEGYNLLFAAAWPFLAVAYVAQLFGK